MSLFVQNQRYLTFIGSKQRDCLIVRCLYGPNMVTIYGHQLVPVADGLLQDTNRLLSVSEINPDEKWLKYQNILKAFIVLLAAEHPKLRVFRKELDVHLMSLDVFSRLDH